MDVLDAVASLATMGQCDFRECRWQPVALAQFGSPLMAYPVQCRQGSWQHLQMAALAGPAGDLLSGLAHAAAVWVDGREGSPGQCEVRQNICQMTVDAGRIVMQQTLV